MWIEPWKCCFWHTESLGARQPSSRWWSMWKPFYSAAAAPAHYMDHHLHITWTNGVQWSCSKCGPFMEVIKTLSCKDHFKAAHGTTGEPRWSRRLRRHFFVVGCRFAAAVWWHNNRVRSFIINVSVIVQCFCMRGERNGNCRQWMLPSFCLAQDLFVSYHYWAVSV